MRSTTRSLLDDFDDFLMISFLDLFSAQFASKLQGNEEWHETMSENEEIDPVIHKVDDFEYPAHFGVGRGFKADCFGLLVFLHSTYRMCKNIRGFY